MTVRAGNLPRAPPQVPHPDRRYRRNYDPDEDAIAKMFHEYDCDGDGMINLEQFTELLVDKYIAPCKSDTVYQFRGKRD